jgi:L-threonylcarbamoyladenylate synthase
VVTPAVEALRRGEPVVVPTDTVYGIAVDPTIPGATQRLFDIKGRGRDVPIAVLVADATQAWSIARAPVPVSAQELAARHWPGALTIVVWRDPAWDADIGDDTETVGVRCPDHDLVRALCRDVGPLATSSANRHGEPTPADFADVRDLAATAVDGGRLSQSASTVVDCTVDPPRVLRQGAVVL